MKQLLFLLFIAIPILCEWNFVGLWNKEQELKPNDETNLNKEEEQNNLLTSGAFENYYIPMLNDKTRNQAFRLAIEKAVKNDTIVLDIGAGQGLLSMIAARAGATKVYGIEKHIELTKITQQILELNSLSDKIVLINKHSFQLEVPNDIPEKADLLLSENLDTWLLGENMIPTVKDARQRLLKPNAKIIPRAATIYCQVIQSSWGFGKDAIIEGFNFEPFRNSRIASSFGFHYNGHPHINLTEPVSTFHFDFEKGVLEAEDKDFYAPVINDGNINAIAMWWDLLVDEEIKISTAPGQRSHWEQGLMMLSSDMPIQKGEKLKITAHHNTTTLSFDIAKILENTVLVNNS